MPSMAMRASEHKQQHVHSSSAQRFRQLVHPSMPLIPARACLLKQGIHCILWKTVRKCRGTSYFHSLPHLALNQSANHVAYLVVEFLSFLRGSSPAGKIQTGISNRYETIRCSAKQICRQRFIPNTDQTVEHTTLNGKNESILKQPRKPLTEEHAQASPST